MKTKLTLGSLFDGIGGFCYAATLTGRIKPIWAAEILFKSESLLGYTPKSKSERADIAGQPADSLRVESSRGEVLGLDFAHADCVVRTFEDKTPTLLQNMGRGGGQTPCVMYEEKRSVIPLRNEVTRMKNSNGLGVGGVGGVCPTLTTTDVHSVFYEVHQREALMSRTYYDGQQFGTYKQSEVVGTILATQAKRANQIIVENIRVFKEDQHSRHCEMDNNTSRTKSVKDVLKKKVQKITYTIRKLTPIECERLQGYPDNWTKYGADGTEIADTARYRAIGNSICVFCAERVYLGILDILGIMGDKEK